mgnify:CR=1 FL=1
MVNYLNGYLIGKGVKPVGLKTYYFWEKIGSARHDENGRSYPHPCVYRLLSIILGTSIPAILGSGLPVSNNASESDSHEIQRLFAAMTRQQQQAFLAMARSVIQK